MFFESELDFNNLKPWISNKQLDGFDIVTSLSYKFKNGVFSYKPSDELKRVCNAPPDPGVYLIFKNSLMENNLLYIGKSENLFNRIAYGEQFHSKRRIVWRELMAMLNINSLAINWFQTTDNFQTIIDSRELDKRILTLYRIKYSDLPPWNVRI